jgi:hypothetical protein
MFRNALQHLHKPLQGSAVSASFTKYATQWTVLGVLSFAGLIIGLDHTIMNGALLSLPGQLGAEDSTLQWLDRAKGIAVRTGAVSEAIGLGQLAGGLLSVLSIGRLSF